MASKNPENIIIDAMKLVESDKRSEIRLNANGGNSILVVCEPQEEINYIRVMRDLMDENNYTIIDLNEILIEYVKNNESDLASYFELLKGSVKQVFKAPEGESWPDLFSEVMKSIEESFKAKKIPVLINSGALYGSGIENIHIMEHNLVMRSELPMIVLYPAVKEGEKLLFLSERPSSKYRCMIVS